MTDKGQQYLFTQDVIRPDQVETYEQAMKDMRAALVSQAFDVPLEIMQMNNQVYYVMSPIDTLDEIDSISHSFVALADSIGLDRYMDILDRSFTAMYHQNHAVIYRHAAFSFWPQGKRPAFGEFPYVHWRVFYVSPAQNQQALEVYCQIANLQQKEKVPCSYDFYTLTIGQGMPAFMVVSHAANASDYHMRFSQSKKMLGKKGEELERELAAGLRRTEEYFGWQRMDLSYHPE